MTLKDLLERSVQAHPESIAFRFKREGAWQEMSYRSFQQEVWRKAVAEAAR